MAVGLNAPEKLLPVAGVRIGITEAGIKRANRRDMVLFELAEGSAVAGVFTKNAFCAAPVLLCKKHLAEADARYWLVNSGNANAGTGEQGILNASQEALWVAEHTACHANEVLPFSTGVIGENLPMDKIEKAIPKLVEDLAEDSWNQAAEAIMTTDTIAKGLSKTCQFGDKTVILTGIAKGSGMICPNMATMLSYVATDLQISKTLLEDLLKQAVDSSFNCITVDSDTSTNDACMIAATGKSGVVYEELPLVQQQQFIAALQALMLFLAQAVIRDGEGATKFVSVRVKGAGSYQEAKEVAYTIAHSPLVKTALFASDPNWGRILAAVGRAPIANLDVNKVNIYLGDVQIVEAGGRSASYREESGQKVMDQAEIDIGVELGRGEAQAVIYTTDFSYDYVKINAEYRS